MNGEASPPTTSRRHVLAGLTLSAVVAGIDLFSNKALAALPERSLTLRSQVLDENVRTVYYANGRYISPAMREIRRLFRDKHNDREIDIDPQLLDTLWMIQRRLAPRSALDVVCGYRSPETNARLRHTTRGVAANSFHMYGRAIDLRIPGCPLGTLHRFALNLEAGGVGYYPRSNFIHIDTGPVRRWGQGRRRIA